MSKTFSMAMLRRCACDIGILGALLLALCRPDCATAKTVTLTMSSGGSEGQAVSKSPDSDQPFDASSPLQFWAFDNVLTSTVAAVAVDPASCLVITEGSFSTPTAPMFGQVTSSIQNLTVTASAQNTACVGKTLPFNVASYTWT